jgi:hypothetical protein
MRSTNQNGAGTSGEHEPEPGTVPQKVSVAPHWNAILGLIAIGVLYASYRIKLVLAREGSYWQLREYFYSHS